MADRAAPLPPGSFLAGLDDATRRSLIDAGRRMSLADGSSLLFEGDDSGRVIVIRPGTRECSPRRRTDARSS